MCVIKHSDWLCLVSSSVTRCKGQVYAHLLLCFHVIVMHVADELITRVCSLISGPTVELYSKSYTLSVTVIFLVCGVPEQSYTTAV